MATSTKAIYNTEDYIDVRDVIARLEELEGTAGEDSEDDDERALLVTLLDDLKGNGGDEQWRGDWYPVSLVRDSYFEDYARELAEDIGAVDNDAKWPYTCIDWEKAASELQMDYTSTEFDGVTYWYRFQ